MRAIFVGDPEGQIRLILDYPQAVGRKMDEILRAVKALQVSDANGVAIPAGWPHNELINDRVIAPPATEEQTAKEHPGQFEKYDGWFRHRSLEWAPKALNRGLSGVIHFRKERGVRSMIKPLFTGCARQGANP